MKFVAIVKYWILESLFFARKVLTRSRIVHKATLLASVLVGVIVSLQCAAAGPSNTEPTVTSSTDPSTKPDPDKWVCRTGAPVVGSRLGARRECATQREWDQRRDDSQKALENSQLKGGSQTSGMPSG